MTDALADIVRRWDLAGAPSTSGELFNQIHERILFLRSLHFDQYIPTLDSRYITDFEMRLQAWLATLPSEADQRIFLELVTHLAFFGRDEFTKLYQTALRGPITRWTIDATGLAFDQTNFDSLLFAELYHHTWYCALSDSMQISDFCHATNLGGIDFRPDFRTLSKFGDPDKIVTFMTSRSTATGTSMPLKRIVILEDFIGSGAQLRDAAPLISTLLSNSIPILLVPLVICPDGYDFIMTKFGGTPLFRLEPVLKLNQALFVNARSTPAAGSFGAALKDLAQRCYHLVVGDNASLPRPYTPYGFSDTGALIVLYSNTPANTLPLIQHSSNSWTALFPRSARVR
jgi:hypothetical protein